MNGSIKKRYSLVAQLIAVIEMILQYHESGIRVLVGEVEPTTQEISDIVHAISAFDEIPQRIAAVFPSSPQERSLIQVEHILDIVSQAGGWERIAETAREFRVIHPRTWSIFRSHAAWIDGNKGTRGEADSVLKKIANKYKISVSTVQRKRNFTVKKVVLVTLRYDKF